MLYTGRVIGAEDAVAWGIASRSAGDDFDEVVDALAREIAAAAPIAVRSTKKTLRGTHNRTIDEAVEMEGSSQAETFKTADAKEGIQAITERRDPDFRGPLAGPSRGPLLSPAAGGSRFEPCPQLRRFFQSPGAESIEFEGSLANLGPIDSCLVDGESHDLVEAANVENPVGQRRRCPAPALDRSCSPQRTRTRRGRLGRARAVRLR